MDEDENEYTSEPLPATPMQGLDLLILATDHLGAGFRLIGSFWGDLTELLCRQANHNIMRKAFASEAGIEIERLVAGE